MANIDELTGVKSKRAFATMEMELNRQIEVGTALEFAVGIFDLNGLKEVNDKYGHRAGDEFLKKCSSIICEIFVHSPVFRVGGDEFAVIAQGSDYENIEKLMDKLNKSNLQNLKKNDVVIAGGIAVYENDRNVDAVYERADARMYEDKKRLKGLE